MGFLDKAKAQVEQAVKQGQDKLEDAQAKKKADGLLRDLGAWHYARATDRDGGQADAEIARIVGELQAHEAEHGPLGGREEEADDAVAAPTDEVAGAAPDGPPPAGAPVPPAPADAPVPPPPGSVPPPPPGAPVPPPPGSVPPPPPPGSAPVPPPPGSVPPPPVEA